MQLGLFSLHRFIKGAFSILLSLSLVVRSLMLKHTAEERWARTETWDQFPEEHTHTHPHKGDTKTKTGRWQTGVVSCKQQLKKYPNCDLSLCVRCIRGAVDRVNTEITSCILFYSPQTIIVSSETVANKSFISTHSPHCVTFKHEGPFTYEVSSQDTAQTVPVSHSAVHTVLCMFRTSQLFIYNAAFLSHFLVLPSGDKQHARRISRETHSGSTPTPFCVILGCKTVNMILYPCLKVCSPLTAWWQFFWILTAMPCNNFSYLQQSCTIKPSY